MTGPYQTDGRGGLYVAVRGSATPDRIGSLRGDVARALDLLNRAAREQDRRHYTASARLYAQAESLVVWEDGLTDDD